MFFTKAPPQRASVVRENGFPFLPWNGKILRAAVALSCGVGIAAQFPNPATPEGRIADSSGISKPISDENFASSDQEATESGGFNYSQPQRPYANNAADAATDTQIVNNFSVSSPAGPIAKYTPPPKMGGGPDTATSPEPAENHAANKPKLASFPVFDTVDYSGFEKTAIDLPLARWNPLFDKAPPLSEMPPRPQPVAEGNKVVAAKPEIQVGETATDASIDLSALILVNHQLENASKEMATEAIIDADALVLARQTTADSGQEIIAIIPDEVLVPVGK